MNEWLFFSHILIVVGFALLALRLGQGALIALIALQGVLANLFVIKQISLFGFSVTCSDVFAIGAILSLNLLQEHFGKEAAKQATRISLVALLFFALMAQIHLFYQPTPADTTHAAFTTVLAQAPRIVFASIAVFYLVQLLDVRLFSLLKGKLPVRVAISLVFSQLLDTVLFSFLGLYGLVDALFDVIVVSFATKCLLIATSAPFVALSKKVVKRVSL